jgi:hypothetical protein
MQRYENFVGLTEVKAAQARVVESEKRFIGNSICTVQYDVLLQIKMCLY